MTILSNPILSGFNPDPSIVRVDDAKGPAWYLATSSFEFLPGLPIYCSRDLVSWELIANVVTRPGQIQAVGVPTGGGVWAPTIRYHGGLFHLVVCDAMGRGMLLFTAADAAGPWSDGMPLTGINGIDPDIAWDDEGTCYVTFSGLLLDGGGSAKHLGIQQVRVDLATGAALEEARSLWSGTGLIFPEAPHLYRIGEWWYLMIAEGGTERGHAESIARSKSPIGPFEGCPWNPLISARSTARPAQNTGHGDLFQATDGSWHMVLLGMRVKGHTRSFAPLGRETFATSVAWKDGWPVVEPVELDPDLEPPVFADDFTTGAFGPEWIGIRHFPAEVAALGAGSLQLNGVGRAMDHPEPTFVGRRVRRLDARIACDVADPRAGVGGLVVRYDETAHYEIELAGLTVVARACLPTMCTERRVPLPDGPVTLWAETRPPSGGFESGMTSDVITFGFDHAGGTVEVGAFDGRYLSAEVACSFTGRVAGLYCVSGSLTFTSYSEAGLP